MKTKSKRKVRLTASDLAKKGGKATLKKHGKSHFSAIAKKRWAKEKKKK
jgi:hypothetical protein